MIIKNLKTLAVTPERTLVLSLAEHGISSVLPKNVLKDFMQINGDFLVTKNKKYTIKNKRIFVVGAGKASAAMAEALEEILGAERITDGIVLSNDLNPKTQKIKIIHADHPVPSEKNIIATEKILALKDKYNIDENDLIIGLVSGGGSAMLVSPKEGITLTDKQKITELLIAKGASGYENTTVKSVLSKVKGGGLARYFAPASIISLIISDDNGKATHEMTASGPFSDNEIQRTNVLKIFENFNLMDAVPTTIISFLQSQNEKPRSNEKSDVSQYIIAENETALSAIQKKAEDEGIAVFMETNIEGEAQDVAHRICEDVRNHRVKKPTLFMYGGETTVTLDYAHKKGGRNQEFALACLHFLRKKPIDGKWCIAAIGTDGIDFIEDSAGGIVDSKSIEIAREQGLDLDVEIPSFLRAHKTGRLLAQINSNICIGRPTGTNVGDIIMVFVSP